MLKYRFAEFFAGGGMARAGLGGAWECLLANDIDPKKCHSYRENWGGEDLFECDIAALPNSVLHQNIDLYWASSPCQDFSLAGKGRGLSGGRSAAFYPWIEQVKRAAQAGYAPKIIAFENVTGLLSANGGKDFTAVVGQIEQLGYFVGATIIDARAFLPQSRPRLFVIGINKNCALPPASIGKHQNNKLPKIEKAYQNLPEEIKKSWIWWKLSDQENRVAELESILEQDIAPEIWFSKNKVAALIGMMAKSHHQKLEAAKALGRPVIGTIYKRGRPNGSGRVVQRAELRLDGIAGCLRTPGGGSSRQTIMLIDGNDVRARLLSAREAARLMGLPDSYKIPDQYNDAYHLAGDGVAVPVVRHLAKEIFEPVMSLNFSRRAA